MDRRVTPPRRFTSPTWGPPPPCKQALILFSSVFLRFFFYLDKSFSKNFSKFTDLKIRHCPCFRNLQLFSCINVHTWSTTVADKKIACKHRDPANFQNNFDRLMTVTYQSGQSIKSKPCSYLFFCYQVKTTILSLLLLSILLLFLSPVSQGVTLGACRRLAQFPFVNNVNNAL